MFGHQTPTPIVTSQTKIVQDSFDQDCWKESSADESLRLVLGANDPPSLKRRLYPFSARLLKPIMGLQEGTIFAHARVKLEPAGYPIVAYYSVNGGSRTTHFNSSEVELILARDDV